MSACAARTARLDWMGEGMSVNFDGGIIAHGRRPRRRDHHCGTAQDRLCPPHKTNSISPRERGGRGEERAGRGSDQNFTVMPEYSEDSVQEPLVTVAPPTTAVQAKARL